MDVPESKKIQLCSILAGIENSNNEEAKLEKWYRFLDLFFNDYSVLKEIYKKMKTNGLCFLHDVGVEFDTDKDTHFFFIFVTGWGQKIKDMDAGARGRRAQDHATNPEAQGRPQKAETLYRQVFSPKP